MMIAHFIVEEFHTLLLEIINSQKYASSLDIFLRYQLRPFLYFLLIHVFSYFILHHFSSRGARNTL